MTTTIEVLVDAIAYFHRAHEPESLAYRLHNPLLLRSFARAGKHEIDEEGRRVFHSSLAGYKAAIFDMEIKLSGRSNARLAVTDALHNLLSVYGLKEIGEIEQVVKYLRRVFKEDVINRDSKLSTFINKEPR